MMSESSTTEIVRRPNSRLRNRAGGPILHPATGYVSVPLGGGSVNRSPVPCGRTDCTPAGSDSSVEAMIVLGHGDVWPTKRRRRGNSCNRVETAGGYFDLLTDELIQHVFSFLPTVDVVRTCVLGRRWRDLWKGTWTNSPSLSFCLPRSLHCRLSSFSSLVSKALFDPPAGKLRRFHLCIPYDKGISTTVFSWLGQAAKRQVEDLCVELNQESYIMEPGLFAVASSMVKLTLRRFVLGSLQNVHWTSLRNLSLERAALNNESFKGILGGCPALELVKLHGCKGLTKIEISSKTVKELVIGFDDSDKVYGLEEHKLEVSAPYLLSLRVLGKWKTRVLRLLDGSSLVEFELNFCPHDRLDSAERSLLRHLLEALQHVKKFIIGTRWLMVLSTFEAYSLPYPMLEQRTLILKLQADSLIPGLLSILASSPFLENLLIDMTPENSETIRRREALPVSSFASQLELHCLSWCLKSVEIVSINADCLGSSCMLSLIQFLLGNAFILEKMIVNIECRGASKSGTIGAEDLSKVCKATCWIQNYYRASENVELVFKYRSKGCSLSMCLK